MKITRLETFLANAGLRNYLFVRLTTDDDIRVNDVIVADRDVTHQRH